MATMEITQEMRQKAIDYKANIAGKFMLVEGAKMKSRISGEDFCVTRKIDGHLQCVFYSNGAAVMLNSRGKERAGELKCLDVFADLMTKAGIKSAVIAAELYLPREGARPRCGDVQTALADSARRDMLALAPFDVIELDDQPFVTAHYKEVYAKLKELFAMTMNDGDNSLCRPVEMRTATSIDELQEIYQEWVEDEGADLTLFEMKVKRQRLKEGEKIDLSKHYNYRYSICPNDSWIDEFAKQCTDVETVKITYGQATMVIKRYSIQGVPFCYYTLNPCEQLVGESMILNETDFSMLNIGTLLMEMAAEMEMRQEELAYHSKKLRLRLMASTVMDDVINFTLWDNTTLSQKIDEYISNGYNTEKIINLALRPWKSAINKYFDLALLRMANESCLRFQKLSHDNPAKEIEKYLKEANLELCDVNLSGDTHSIIISYQNYQCFAQISSTNNICLIPTTCCCSETIKLPSTTPLEIFALFIKQMPTINKPANDYVDKVRQLYTQKLRERAK